MLTSKYYHLDMMLKMINLYVKECLRELVNYSMIIMLVLSLTRDVNFPGTYELFQDNHASLKFNLANLQ